MRDIELHHHIIVNQCAFDSPLLLCVASSLAQIEMEELEIQSCAHGYHYSYMCGQLLLALALVALRIGWQKKNILDFREPLGSGRS